MGTDAQNMGGFTLKGKIIAIKRFDRDGGISYGFPNFQGRGIGYFEPNILTGLFGVYINEES